MLKTKNERPFDFVMGDDDMKYCKHHGIMMIFHPKAMTEYCPLCWIEGYRPKCDL